MGLRGLETDHPGSERGRRIALVAVCLILFFVGLGAYPLWDQDEGMHAATSRDMIRSGDWITPTFNGENFYDKPAGFNWLVAISLQSFGFTAWAARFPAALCGLIGVLAAYGLGRRMFGAQAGFLGAIVLATSGGWLVLSRVVVHDIALAVSVALALLSFWNGYRSETKQALPWLLFWIFSGAAVVAKGPPGLMPLLIVGLFVLIRREWSLIRRMRPVAGLLLYVAVTAPWYIAVSLSNPDYLHYFLVYKTFGSLATAHGAGRVEPFYYYGHTLLALLLPWSGFIPFAVIGAWRKRSPQTTLLLIWALAPTLLLSLATAKLATYLVPVLPAFALLIGVELAELTAARDAAFGRRFWLPAAVLATVALVPLSMAFGGLPEGVLERGVPDGTGRVLVGLFAAGLVSGGVLLLRRRVRLCVVSLAAGIGVLILGFVLIVAPTLSPQQSSRELGRVVDEAAAPGAPVYVYVRVVGVADAALFYTDRQMTILKNQAEVLEALDRETPLVLVIANRYMDGLLENPEIASRLTVMYRAGERSVLCERPT